MTAPDLRARLERVYRDYTGAPSGHGAQTWVAKVARMDVTSVNRMLAGVLPSDRLEAALDMLEMSPVREP